MTCKKFNTNRVLRRKIKLEEYCPEMDYIPGEKNIAADANGNQDTTHG